MTTPYTPVPIRRFLKELTDGPFGSSLTGSHYSDSGARVIRLGNIGEARFKAGDEAYIPMEYFAELQRHSVESGDLLIAGLGDLGNPVGRACLAPEGLGPAIVKADCFRARLDEHRLLHRFAAWALNSKSVGQQVLTLARGSTRARINLDVAKAIEIPVPPLNAQRGIADYLDRETARIDMLIEEQQRLIGMLRERRDSAWAACVEKARCLGRHVTVRRTIESIVDGPFGSSLASAHYSDEGARVIRLGNIGVNEFKDGVAAFIPLDYAEELDAHAVKQGDVVVAGLGDDKMPLGRAAVVPALGPAIVKADCYRLRPNEQVDAAYLAWVMSAPQTRSQIMLLARGSTRARLNTKVVQQVEVPLPSREMQDALVSQSDAEAAKIDALIAETERFIEFSKERRAALITAAVTGQIDVREMA